MTLIWHGGKRGVYGVLPCFCAVFLSVFQIVFCEDFCRVRTSGENADGDIKLTLMFSIRKESSIHGGCGAISDESIQQYVAVKWALEKLNSGNTTFIPGVKIGFQLYDDCRSETFAARNALSLINPTLPQKITDCLGSNSSSALNIGIIGPSRSSTTSVTAKLLQSTGIPIISPSATLSTFSDKVTYPSVLRTASSDTYQVKVIVEILKKLEWSYVAIVHTPDSYGINGMQALMEKTKDEHICITKAHELDSQKSSNIYRTILEELRTTTLKTQGNTLAVIYFGQKDVGENLLFEAEGFKGSEKFHWIMSDAVGKNEEVFRRRTAKLVEGALTISPSRTQLPGFNSYYSELIQLVRSSPDSDVLVREYLSQQPARLPDSDPSFQHNDYVPLTIDAVYALIIAFKNAHEQYCSGQPGLCDILGNTIKEGTFLQTLQNVNVNYTSLSPTIVPEKYQEEKRSFHFDRNGDVMRGTTTSTYVINSYDSQNSNFIQVGQFIGGSIQLDKTKIKMMMPNGVLVSGNNLPKSACEGYCKECIDDTIIPMVYIPGDVYILGLFSIHEKDPEGRFGCEGFRSVSSDTVYLEGFIHAVQEARTTTGINYGGIAFDDCYNPLKIGTTLSVFFGDTPFTNQSFSHPVPWNRVASVIGSLSSGVTIPVAQFFNRLNIPVISYSSTSPDLDDKTNFPYFLRTVPSDVEQAEAMVAFIKKMGWEYVDVMYVANNYGTKGKDAFLRIASASKVCVGEPLKINADNIDDAELFNTILDLHKRQAKVVVFFGIDTRYEDFMNALNEKQDFGEFLFIVSEEWGTKKKLLEIGGRAARGTIALNLASPPIEDEKFVTYMLQRNLNNTQNNPWFNEFWQHLFKCNTKGSFNTQYDEECSPNLRLNEALLQGHLRDERISHVRSAVYAVADGTKKSKELICKDSTFPCSFYYDPKYSPQVLAHIRDSVLMAKISGARFKLFDSNGNGANGFKIYNIQQKNRSTLEYVEIGSYIDNRLTIHENDIKFYDELGNQVTNIKSKCDTHKCSKCDMSVPEITTEKPPGGQTGNIPDNFRVADTIILTLVAIIIVFLVLVILITCCFFKRKVEEMSKQMQAIENQHMYEPVRDGTYQNRQPMDQTRFTPGHDRIQFVNPRINSLNSLNHIGVNNGGFMNDEHYLQVNGSILSNGSLHGGSLPTKSDSSQQHIMNHMNLSPQQSRPTSGTTTTPLSQFYGSHLYMDDPRAHGTTLISNNQTNRNFHLPIQVPYTPASPQTQFPQEETVEYSDVVTPPEPSENLHQSPQHQTQIQQHQSNTPSPSHSEHSSRPPGTPYQMSPTASVVSSIPSSRGRSSISTVSPTDADPHGLRGQRSLERMPKPPRQNLAPNLPQKIPSQLPAINRQVPENVSLNDVNSPLSSHRTVNNTSSPMVGGRPTSTSPISMISSGVPVYPSSQSHINLEQDERRSGSMDDSSTNQDGTEARISRV